MSGESTISAGSVFFNNAETETYSTITMKDDASLVTRDSGNLYFRGKEVSLTMSDNSKIVTGGTGATGTVYFQGGNHTLSLSDNASISSFDVIATNVTEGSVTTLKTNVINITGGTIKAAHDMLIQNQKSTITLNNTKVELGMNFRLRQTDKTSSFTMNGTSSLTSAGTLEIGNWDDTGGSLILNDQSKLTANVGTYNGSTFNTTYFANNANSSATVQLNDSSEMILNTNFSMSNNTNAVSSLELTGDSKMVVAHVSGQTVMISSGTNSSATITLKDNATLVFSNGGNSGSRQRFSNGVGSTATLDVQGGKLVFYGGTCFGEHNIATTSTEGSTTVNLSGGSMTAYGLIVGSRISTDFTLSNTGVLNVWNKMVMQFYDVMENSAIVNQEGGTANIWGSSSAATMWSGGAGIVFGQQATATRKPGTWTISGGDLNTCNISLYTKYTPASHDADDSLLVIKGGNVNLVAQTGIANGTLAVPTTMTGGTLNAARIVAKDVMYNDTFLQQGGVLSPDGGTAVTPSTYANTGTGKEAYEIAELMGFTEGTESATTLIDGNYEITSLDSNVSRAEIRLDQDAAGNYDLIDITGSMNIGDDVLLSIYLAGDSLSGSPTLITADGGITGVFAELQVFNNLGNLLEMDVRNLIYDGNTIVLANLPEPATWGMLLLGIFFLAGRKGFSGRKKS